MLVNATISGGFIFTSELGVGTSMLKKWAYAVIFLIVMIFPIQIVSAHSPIEKRVPEKDAVLQVSPVKVELFFEESVEIHRSSIIVRNVAKEEVQVGRPQLDPSDDRHILIDLKKNLSPGTYNVGVDVISIDGHGLKESYSFELKEPPKENKDIPSFTLDRTFPEDGSILQESPKQIDLWFSKPTELSVFGLLNDKQQSLDTKKPYADPNDPKHFIIELSGTIKGGTYSLVSYAKTDDKEDYKIKYFAVKNVTSITGSASSSNDSIWKHIGLLQLAHWLSYIGMFLLIGSSWFRAIISAHNETNLKWKKISPYVYVFSGAAILFELILNKFQYSEVVIRDFITFNFIWIPIIQLILLTISYFVRWYRGKQILLILSLLCFALTGHSVAPPYGGMLGVVLDFLHLLAASIWVGGLFVLFFMAPKENTASWLKETTKVFSKWALWSIVVIGFTGVWMTLKYVPSFTFRSMLQSYWGEVVLAKIVLYVAIIGLGYWQRKLLLRWVEILVTGFRKLLRIELVIAAVLLLLAGFLVDLSPKEAEQGIYPTKQVQQGIEAKLMITPLQAGANDIDIGFVNAQDIKKVSVKFYSTNGWSTENSAFLLENGVFKLTGSFFHGAGTINMDVQAIKSNGDRVVFPYRIQVPGVMDTNNS